MPRSERRRWWLERSKREGFVLRNNNTEMRRRMLVEDSPQDLAIVKLWRLVQWQKMRLNRALVECDIRAGMKCADEAAWSRILLDADAAVLASRCSEEAMRVECEGYRNAELQEQVGDLALELAQAVQRDGEMRDELLRLRDVVCKEDVASIDRVIGEPVECDYPDCGHGPACVGCDEYHPEHDDK